MSMSPNDPFEDAQHDQFAVQSPPPARSGSKTCLIGCLIVAGLGLLVCCGGVIFLARGGSEMLSRVLDQAMSAEFKQQLDGSPVIQEHIGTIESLNFDLGETISNAQETAEQGGDPKLVFHIRGDMGSGQVWIERADSGTGIKSATLVMSDGTRHVIETAFLPEEDLDVELDDLFDDGDVVPQPPGAETTPPLEVEND